MAKAMTNHASIFEQIRQTDAEGNEFWQARQLAKAFGYSCFRNFTAVIEKAKEACINSGQPVENHIVETNEMVAIGSGAERELPGYKLSRYACYLIVQNADQINEDKAIIKAAISATIKANRAAKKTGLPLYEVEGGKLYKVLPGGEMIFIKNIGRSDVKLPVNLKLK